MVHCYFAHEVIPCGVFTNCISVRID